MRVYDEVELRPVVARNVPVSVLQQILSAGALGCNPERESWRLGLWGLVWAHRAILCRTCRHISFEVHCHHRHLHYHRLRQQSLHSALLKHAGHLPQNCHHSVSDYPPQCLHANAEAMQGMCSRDMLHNLKEDEGRIAS